MKKIIIIQIIFIFIINMLLISFLSQSYVLGKEKTESLVWDYSFGGKEYDEIKSIIQTAEGDYLAVGCTNSKGAGETDGWVIKLDQRGNLKWDRTFGGANNDRIYDVIQTKDGGYLLTGWKELNKGNIDAWIIKLEEEGNLEWEKSYDLSENDKIYSIIQTKEGSYVATGCIISENGKEADAWVIKLDISGNVIWSNIIEGSKLNMYCLYKPHRSMSQSLFEVLSSKYNARSRNAQI